MKRPCAIIFPLVLLCLWIAGCTPASTREALARADSIMAAAPDSALTILDALDPATLNSPGTRAIYAVSLTEARYKTDIPIQNDSLISVATDYYLTHGSPEEKARAFYFSAIVKYLDSNYEQAIVDGLRAEKHALSASDHLRLGLIYRTIADCFRELYDASSAIHYYTVSYEHFRLAPTQKYTGWGLVDLSRANIIKGDNETALRFAYQALGYADSVGNDDLKVNALRNIAGANFYSDEYDETIKYLETLRALRSQALLDDDYELLGESYLVMGNPVKAQECQDSLNARQSDTYGLQVMLYEKAGEFESANRLQGKMLEYQNNEVKKLFTRNYARTISNYYDIEEEKASERIESEKTQKNYIGSIMALVIAVLVFIFFYRTRMLKSGIDKHILVAQNLRNILQQKDSAMEKLNDEIIGLQAKLSSSDTDAAILKNELNSLNGLLDERKALERKTKEDITHLFSEKFKLIDQLCSSYYQYHDIPNKQTKIASEIIEIINGISNDSSILERLEENANRYLDGIMRRFRRDIPNLNDWEYTLFLYIVLGFSNRAVCVFQNIKLETYYNRKSSLKRKISKFEVPYKEEYLMYLG